MEVYVIVSNAFAHFALIASLYEGKMFKDHHDTIN